MIISGFTNKCLLLKNRGDVKMAVKRKKRTLTPEQIAKMQEGKAKAKRHRAIVADAEKLEKRMHDAMRDADKPVRLTGRRHHKRTVRK